MANDVTAVFGGDTSQFDRAISNVRSSLKATAAEATRTLTFTPRLDDRPLKQALAKAGRGGGSNFLSAASPQIADISIQMQMGAKGATIFAQQVPQLLSAFGPGAAILGGVAAVGGALWSVGQNSVDAFDKLIKGAQDSHTSVAALASSGGLGEVLSKLKEISTQSEALGAERGKVGGVGAQLGRLIGGASPGERTLAIQDQQIKSADDLRALQERVVGLSNKELQIASMKANGREKEAAELERQVELRKELARINEMPIGNTAKGQLRENARTASQNKAEAAERDAAAKEKARTDSALQAAREQLSEQKIANAEGPSKLALLEERAAKMRQFAEKEGLGTTEAEAAKLTEMGSATGEARSLTWIKEYRDVMDEIDKLSAQLKADAIATAQANAAAAKAKAAEQQAFEAMVDAENERINEEQSAAATQKAGSMTSKASSLTEMATSAALTNARAHGHTRKAERMESALGAQQKTQQLIESGMNPADAARAARGMQRDEDKVNGIRSTIGRAPAGSTRGASPMDLLKGAAGRAQQAAAKAAKDNQVTFKEGAEMLAELKALNAKLKLVN